MGVNILAEVNGQLPFVFMHTRSFAARINHSMVP
jgi:hypothetical protein